MAFRDWEEVEASNPLELPIRGKTYRMPALGHLDAIRLREEMEAITAGGKPSLSNDDFLTAVLGEKLLAQMHADNVPDAAIIHAAIVSQTDATLGREEAEAMWEKGPSPEAIAAALKLATAANADSTTSPGTPPKAPTSSTKKPASTPSTKSPQRRARKSTGTTSSTSRSSSRRTSRPSTA